MVPAGARRMQPARHGAGLGRMPRGPRSPSRPARRGAQAEDGTGDPTAAPSSTPPPEMSLSLVRGPQEQGHLSCFRYSFGLSPRAASAPPWNPTSASPPRATAPRHGRAHRLSTYCIRGGRAPCNGAEYERVRPLVRTLASETCWPFEMPSLAPPGHLWAPRSVKCPIFQMRKGMLFRGRITVELESSCFKAVVFPTTLSALLLFSRSLSLSFGGEVPRRDPSQGIDTGPKPSQRHHNHGPPRGSPRGASPSKGPGGRRWGSRGSREESRGQATLRGQRRQLSAEQTEVAPCGRPTDCGGG